MRIIHTSDWHLGQYFYGKSRAKEHQQFLDWLLIQAKENAVDAIIVAGDVFDTSTPPSYAREMYFTFIGEIQKIQCQLIVLAGNHDSVAMLNESQQLLQCLNTKVIAYADIDDIGQQVFTLKNSQHQPVAVICAVPFIRPRDVIKSQAGQSAKQKQQTLQQAISDHYQKLYGYAQTLATAAEAESEQAIPIIATGHLTVMGVTGSDSVRDIYIGSLEAFPADAFPPADYIALGHIHRAQKVSKSEHIRYCGSPIALSFDEAKQHKKVLMVDFSTVEQAIELTVTEIEIPCFQPLAMIKTDLPSLNDHVAKLVEDIEYEQVVWCDIEINSAEYLQDLQPRINKLVEQYPVEVLLVRRSKKSRQLLQAKQEKTTLNELTLDDVFNSRLAQELWESEKELSQKQKLQQLFQQTVEQVTTQSEHMTELAPTIKEPK